jgi:hypothetical protein
MHQAEVRYDALVLRANGVDRVSHAKKPAFIQKHDPSVSTTVPSLDAVIAA